MGDSPSSAQTEGGAEDAAEETEDEGLEHKLMTHLSLLRAQGAPEPNFDSTLSKGQQHEIHYADPTDDEGNRGNGSEQEGERAGLIFEFADGFLCRGHVGFRFLMKALEVVADFFR